MFLFYTANDLPKMKFMAYIAMLIWTAMGDIQTSYDYLMSRLKPLADSVCPSAEHRKHKCPGLLIKVKNYQIIWLKSLSTTETICFVIKFIIIISRNRLLYVEFIKTHTELYN